MTTEDRTDEVAHVVVDDVPTRRLTLARWSTEVWGRDGTLGLRIDGCLPMRVSIAEARAFAQALVEVADALEER